MHKAPKFRSRRLSAQAAAPACPASVSHSIDLPSRSNDEPGEAVIPGSAKIQVPKVNEAGIAKLQRAGLTGPQLRMARHLAQEHGFNPSLDFDAVRSLRDKNIEPFALPSKVELAKQLGAASKALIEHKEKNAKAQTTKQLSNPPQTIETEKNLPVAPVSSVPSGPHQIERMQREIARRRRRKLIFLGMRLSFFVLLPTMLAFFYFTFLATPSYATKSQFVVQQAEAAVAQPGLSGGTTMATSQDSILVQGFLTSREALQRLNTDHGYHAHFSDPSIDALQRIAAAASNEAIYTHFQNHVKIGYDPTEGVIRMEVSALSPEMSQTLSEALIGYAEERVDQITGRKRETQMRYAHEILNDAEAKMVQAQAKVLALQEQLGILDPALETAGIMAQVNTFETQLAKKRLRMNQLLDNTRPNAARVAGVDGDIKRLQVLIGRLRAQLTEGTSNGSLASITAKLSIAEVDLETRTMMMQESLQQLEMARVEASRQVRFLSLGVRPVPSDIPSYPRVFENTLITFLILGAIYLLVSITLEILREQVTS